MTIPPDPLAQALIAAGLDELTAYETAERAAIVESEARKDRQTAELIATGGWTP